MWGHDLERRLYGARARIAERFDLKRPKIAHWPAYQSDSENPFTLAVEEAEDRGVITSEEESRLQVTDAVFSATRKLDGKRVFIAVEASSSISRNDIERAARSAEILQKVFGEPARALVVGYSIRDTEDAAAKDMRVDVMIMDEVY